jgi:hypothetical protein
LVDVGYIDIALFAVVVVVLLDQRILSVVASPQFMRLRWQERPKDRS